MRGNLRCVLGRSEYDASLEARLASVDFLSCGVFFLCWHEW